jgi:hypothetical protein
MSDTRTVITLGGKEEVVTATELARRYRAHAAMMRRDGAARGAEYWEKAAVEVETGCEPVFGGG